MENQTLIPIIFYGQNEQNLIDHLQTNYPTSKFIYLTIEAQNNSSIKIDQIHQLQAKLAITSNKSRLVWLKQAHLATIPAQNSLLKILEEPPQQTLFVLTTTNPGKLLETITSRCRLYYLPTKFQNPKPEILNQLKNFLGQDFGQRLAQLKNLPKDKIQALSWLEEIILNLNLARKQTKDINKLKIFSKIIQPALETKTYLQANLNPTLAIEHFLLSLPKTSN